MFIDVGYIFLLSFSARECETCQLNNPDSLDKNHEPMRPVPAPKKVWSKVGVDMLGPFTREDGVRCSMKHLKCKVHKLSIDVTPLCMFTFR